MRNYELTMLLKADLPEGQTQALLGEIASMLQDQGALLISQGTSGKRILPSPVEKQGTAELAVLKFSLDPAKLEAMEKNLKAKDSILRFVLLSYMPRRAQERVMAQPGAKAPEREESQESKADMEDIDKRLEEIFKQENL